MKGTMTYQEYDPCPYKPLRTVEWLEKHLSKDFFKKPYDRFMWWRSYTPKKKPITGNVMVIAKIESGAYDEGPYRYEIELCEHRLRKKFFELQGDYSRFLEDQAVELARRKRLREDLDKDENKKLEMLYTDFSRAFGINKTRVQEEIMDAPGESLVEVYRYLEKKFLKTR